MILHFLTIPLIVQVTCGIHAVKTGRTNWLWIILFFSLPGCLIYFFVEVLPQLQPAANRAASTAEKILIPQAQLKRLKEALDNCDNVDNRSALADAYVQNGQFNESLELLKVYTKGQYATDPHIQAQLALSFYMTKDFSSAKSAILRSKNDSNKFESNNYHLLYAMTLEKLNDIEKACSEYKTLKNIFIGEEVNCRYALLLTKLGEIDEAKKLFQSTIKKCKTSPAFYQKENLKWFNISKKQMENL